MAAPIFSDKNFYIGGRWMPEASPLSLLES